MFKHSLFAFLCLSLIAVSAQADKRHSNQWEITITNLTPGQSFTPRLFIVSQEKIDLISVGDPASPELEAIAEAGDTSAMVALLGEYPSVIDDIQVAPGLLGPGATETLTFTSRSRAGYLSLAAMLIPTNDTFVALDSVALPKKGEQIEYAIAYDAGTEANDQNCLHIPGPVCGGEALSAPASTDEGFVHVGNGFHLLSDPGVETGVLTPAKYDWNNPVAKIAIRAVR